MIFSACIDGVLRSKKKEYVCVNCCSTWEGKLNHFQALTKPRKLYIIHSIPAGRVLYERLDDLIEPPLPTTASRTDCELEKKASWVALIFDNAVLFRETSRWKPPPYDSQNIWKPHYNQKKKEFLPACIIDAYPLKLNRASQCSVAMICPSLKRWRKEVRN